MENPEEILHSLEEFAKLKPKDIPRELEEYLCFVAKTGDPIYQWPAVKSLFKEKLINVITEFYESCPSVEIPPCPNVEMFNYDSMKNFIIEKLDTFAAAPFTVQRICELLTTPRKEYNRIDKYMRALEKNILVVSTTEPGNRRNTENGEGIVNGIESEHITEGNSNNDINVEEMDDAPIWPRMNPVESNNFANADRTSEPPTPVTEPIPEATTSECPLIVEPSTSAETVITCSVVQSSEPIEKVTIEEVKQPAEIEEDCQPVTVPAQVQRRRNSIEPITSSDDNAVGAISETTTEHTITEYEGKNDALISESSESSNTDSSSNDTVSYALSPEENVTSKSELEVDSSESLDSSDDKTEEKVEITPIIVEPTIIPDTIEEPPVETEAVPESSTDVVEETIKITEITEVVEENTDPIPQEAEAPVLTEPVVTFPAEEDNSTVTSTAAEIETPEPKIEGLPLEETKLHEEEETPMDVDVAVSSSTESTADVPNDETNSV